MHRHYQTSEFKNVAITYVYANEKGGYLYTDEKRSVTIKKERLLELLMNGITIEFNNEYLLPLHVKDSTNGLGIVVTAYNGTEFATFKSEEAD